MRDQLSRLDFLKESHRKLDFDIKKAYNSFIDDDTLHKMKLQKLHLKDKIEKLQKEIDNEVRPS